jgi:hypothetical protein
MLKDSVKMRRHVPHEKPWMLQTFLIYDAVCPYSWLDALFPHLYQPEMTMGDLKVQNPQPKYGHFWKANIIQRFVVHTWRHNERLWKHFVSLKTWCNFFVSWSVTFHWATAIAEHSNTNTLKGKLHTKQRSLTATIITLIHNKSTQRYLVAYSRLLSSWRSTRPARELLTARNIKVPVSAPPT